MKFSVVATRNSGVGFTPKGMDPRYPTTAGGTARPTIQTKASAFEHLRLLLMPSTRPLHGCRDTPKPTFNVDATG